MELFYLAIPSIISAVALGAMGAVLRQVKKILKALEANNDATRYILKERILHMCRKHQQLGAIPSEEGEILQELFREYKRLGGNSFVEAQVEKTLALPLVKE